MLSRHRAVDKIKNRQTSAFRESSSCHSRYSCRVQYDSPLSHGLQALRLRISLSGFVRPPAQCLFDFVRAMDRDIRRPRGGHGVCVLASLGSHHSIRVSIDQLTRLRKRRIESECYSGVQSESSGQTVSFLFGRWGASCWVLLLRVGVSEP